MEKIHNFAQNQTVLYEGVEVDIEDFPCPLSVRITGLIGKYFYFQKHFKSKLHKFFGISYYTQEEGKKLETKTVSYYNLKTINN